MAGPEETWKPVSGYVGYYEVSDQGRVRSVDRMIWHNCGREVLYRGRVLRQKMMPRGHRQVTLSRDGDQRTVLVHRLVLEAFVGPAPEGTEGLHWDDDPGNNRASNLRWGTRSENIADRIRNGRRCGGIRIVCKRGHPMSGDNVRTLSDGKRRCATCLRKTDREWHAAKRREMNNAA